MRAGALLVASAAAAPVAAAPNGRRPSRMSLRRQTENPWEGKKLFANPTWAAKLETTYNSFIAKGDTVNAAKVRTVQNTGSFVWVTTISSLPGIDAAIASARAAKEATGEDQIVGLVLYNLPDRDCSAGESAGELKGAAGLERYKSEFVTPYAAKLAAASDLTFAVVLEPDSLPNVVTNMGIPLCAEAAPLYKEGIAYAIQKLQIDNVHVYLDAAHGGWLGWDDNLPLTADVFAQVAALAGNGTRIRGFSTNVSNYNPYYKAQREPFDEWSNSYDEYHYHESLAPHLEAAGLPARFIVDQGRVAKVGAREEWGDWCNVEPAGFGMVPGTTTNSTILDSVVWIKPGGESDGACGLAGAPVAGAWFDGYVQMLVENADESLVPATM